MKKRPFLLIEALIALTLLTLCAVPLVRQPIQFYKDGVDDLMQMEMERLADWSFTEVRELLLKNEIPWKEIPPKDGTTGPFSLPDATLQIPSCAPQKVQRHFFLTTKGEKITKQDILYRQLHVKICLNDAPFFFRLPVEKGTQNAER